MIKPQAHIRWRYAILHFSICTLALSCLLLVSSCGRNYSTVAEQSEKLADQLFVHPQPQQSGAVSVERRVYIDHSESMRGFVGNPAMATRTTFDDFIDALPDVLPGCSVFRYGQQRRQNQLATNLSDIAIQVEFNRQLHNRELYGLEYNPDGSLIRGLVAEQRPVLSILVTDGVESDSHGTINTVVVDAIKAWMSEGKVFAILALKSRFSGRFYSESHGKMLNEVSVDARPFYAFVFSPNLRELEDLQEKLARRFPQILEIVFSDNSISGHIELPTENGASYANNQPPNKPYYWQMLSKGKLEPNSEVPFAYKFTYDINPSYPMKSLGMRLTFKLHRWDASGEQFQQEPVVLPINIKFGSEIERSGEPAEGATIKQSFLLTPQWLSDANDQSDYSFYSVEQSPYIKEIRDEIAALSTRDDSTTASADKTYRFQELIFALLDVHLKDCLIPRMSQYLFITVAN
jgi:hypothetical protein